MIARNATHSIQETRVEAPKALGGNSQRTDSRLSVEVILVRFLGMSEF